MSTLSDPGRRQRYGQNPIKIVLKIGMYVRKQGRGRLCSSSKPSPWGEKIEHWEESQHEVNIHENH
ncbi:MAG: hypothetical protein ACK4QP_01890 [Pseudorhizobium sp.]